MVCGIGRIGQSIRLAALAGIAVACMFAVPARATDTVIQSIVNSGTQPVPALAITGIANNVNITSLPFQLQGTVVNLSQIRVYIDDVFSVTIPLAQGMTTFSDNLVFSQGTHAVKLVGISPYANISPTVSFTLTYTYAPPPTSTTDTQDVPNAPNSPNESNNADVSDNPTSTTSERYGGGDDQSAGQLNPACHAASARATNDATELAIRTFGSARHRASGCVNCVGTDGKTFRNSRDWSFGPDVYECYFGDEPTNVLWLGSKP